MCLVECLDLNEISQSNDILHKVSKCFGNDIIINGLPQTVCIPCVDKIEDIYTFRHLIIHNQNILLNRVKEIDKLSDFDTSITIKTETKLENDGDYDVEVNLEIKEEQIETNEDDESKSEINGIDTFNSDSEDNIALSMLEQPENVTTDKDNKSEETAKNDYADILRANRCLTCFKSNSSQNELVRHYNEIHKNKPENQQTGTEVKTYETVTTNGCLKYKCILCEKIFDSKRKLKKHAFSHIQDRPFLCKLCGRTYKTVSDIVRHARAHSGSKMSCKYQCGYSTAYVGALKNHERRHSTDYTYTCEECGKGFQVLTWYEQHQNVHTGVKPFVCEICGVAFHMDRYLKAHMTLVHPQISSRKRFLCVHCSKPCDSKNGLRLHLKEHGITSKFLCDICGKELSDSRQLRFHKRVHLGDRPYTCRFHKGNNIQNPVRN
ncbi:zinc finger protein OZF-like isoform X2 [Battus philenor]|uniref:zinc finger protein OZF-like isoform X2 n=1 Tax=Battus philenor TaxID=42288 RepID=UPI0035CEAFF4